MEKTCLVCKKSFRTWPSKVKNGRGKYCSRKCSDSQTLIKKGQHISPDTEIKKGQHIEKVQGWRYCGRGKQYKEIYLGNRKYRREHILVMEARMGRRLGPNEEIHHIDGNGLNNNLDNLRLMTKSDHLKLEHKLGRYRAHLAQLQESR